MDELNFNKGINKIILEYYTCKPKFLSELLVMTYDIKHTLDKYKTKFMGKYKRISKMEWIIRIDYFRLMEPMGYVNYSRFKVGTPG